jgi:nitroreductase
MQEQTMHDAATLLDKRYGGAGPDLDAINETIALILRHYSVRHYSDVPLPEGTLETLMAAGQSGATSSNMQNWSVVAVTDPDRRAQLSALSQSLSFVAECSAVLCFVVDLSRARRLEARKGLNLSALTTLEVFLTALTDCAIAAQNMVVAAESLGLGTCYLGALRNNTDAVADLLALPNESFAAFGLCVGHERKDQRVETIVKPRLPQAVTLHRETYSSEVEDARIDAFDAMYLDFGSHSGRIGKPWSTRVQDRLGSPEYLSGREDMVAMLKRRGFELT